MSWNRALNCLFSIFLGILLTEVSGSCKGCVELDTLTFDKVVSSFDHAVVKFDISYPYGEKHEQFEEFSSAVGDVKNLLVAVVGVKDYGDKDNEDLAKRFDVATDKFPVIKLFNKKNIEKPIEFSDSEWTSDTIRKFVRQHTNLYIGLAGCIEEFDKFARKFSQDFDKEGAAQMIMEQAKKLAETYKGQKEGETAKIYIAYMERIIERGLAFVQAEKQRVKKLLDGKLSDTKKQDLKRRLNVLESFALLAEKNKKSEKKDEKKKDEKKLEL